jgi:hypothetical protein
MIGLSISRCVRDICKGRIKIENVVKIIGASSFENLDQITDDANCYICWVKNPELAKKIITELWEQGKIEQPRLHNNNGLVPDTHQGVWIHKEDQINWVPWGSQGYCFDEEDLEEIVVR